MFKRPYKANITAFQGYIRQPVGHTLFLCPKPPKF
nr:MAG TPA: hypothetical protein [Caudoviricetes sp.]